MKLLSLDLSKSRTGWALWHDGWPLPLSGSWVFGGGDGRVFHTLHVRLDELHREHGFQTVFYEQPINPQKLHQKTNIRANDLALGLASHVLSYAWVRKCTALPVHIETWRLDYVGRDELARIRDAAKAKKRATGKHVSQRDDLKAATVARCRQLGLEPKSDDEAEALGILDHAIGLQGMTPPWRTNEVLRAPLGDAA